MGLTSRCVWQRHKRNAGLAGDSTGCRSRIQEFLLNAAFQEFGFGAVGTNFAMHEHGIFLDPDEGSSEG